jgi:hypothetical protein
MIKKITARALLGAFAIAAVAAFAVFVLSQTGG